MTKSTRYRLRARRILPLVGISAGALAGALGILTAATTVLVARTIISPPRSRLEDIRVLAFDLQKSTITLSSIADSRLPGRYSFWFSGGRGHARLGDVIAQDSISVTRSVLSVEFGDLASARRGRFSGWFYLGPRDLGYPFERVEIVTQLGLAPAWLIPSANPTGRWVIQVHGRAVKRSEALRAVPVFREAGYSSLLVSYRNDGDAPDSDDHRYALGDTEWKDVESAMLFAIERGATDIVLMGWSMGGATVLQTLTRSPLVSVVRGVVLESPVIDWVSALMYQADLMKLPMPIRTAVLSTLSTRWGSRLTGQDAPINLDRLDLVRHSDLLRTPILILHSDDDGYIPASQSHLLAQLRPDIVTLEVFTVARHTKLWNYDQSRFDAAISSWLAAILNANDHRDRSRHRQAADTD